MRKFSVCRWMVIIVVVIAALTIGSLLAVGLITAICEDGIGSGDAAAWMQAIGAAVAIAGAYSVANMERSHAKARDEDIAAEDNEKLVTIVNTILRLTSETVKEIKASWNVDRQRETIAAHIPLLEDCKTRVLEIPIFKISDPRVAIRLIVLPRSIQRLSDAVVLSTNADMAPDEYVAEYETEVRKRCDVVLLQLSEAAQFAGGSIETLEKNIATYSPA